MNKCLFKKNRSLPQKKNSHGFDVEADQSNRITALAVGVTSLHQILDGKMA